MEKHFAMLRRPLAMLLAVLMVLSAFNGAIVSASAAEATAKLSELVDDKEIATLIASGYVFEDKGFSYSEPTNKDDLISVDETAGTVTAQNFTDAYGNVWYPVDGRVVNSEGTEEELVFSGNKADFDAAKAGLNYTVEVAYQLQLNTGDEVEYLENIVSVTDAMIEDYKAMYELLDAANEDLDFMYLDLNEVTGRDMFEGNVLSALMGMTSGGWQVQIGEEYALNVVMDNDDIYDAAELLNEQLADGTALDLEDLLDGKSEMEVLVKDMDQMDEVLLEGTYYPIDDIDTNLTRGSALKTAVDTAVKNLKAETVAAAEAELGSVTDEMRAEIEAEINTAVEDSYVYDAVSYLIELFKTAEKDLSGAAVRTEDEEWLYEEYADLVAADADYAKLSEMIAELNDYSLDASGTMWVEVYSTVEYRKASNKVTVTVNGSYYNEAGELETLDKVYETSFYVAQGEKTLSDLDRMIFERNDVAYAVDDFINAARDADGVFEDTNDFHSNFSISGIWSVDTNEAIAEDVVYTVTMAPKEYAVSYTGVNGDSWGDSYAYGSRTAAMPVSDDAAVEYNYKVEATVNGETVTTWVNQGQTVRILGETEITQVKGDASATMDLSQLIGKDYTKVNGNAAVTTDEGAILNTTALKDVAVTIRVPNNAQTLKNNGYIILNKEDNTVVVKDYIGNDAAADAGWVWTASSVKVSYNEGEPPVEVTLTDAEGVKKATVDTLAFDEVFVTYELKLTDEALAAIGADDTMVQALRNAPAELVSEYAYQKSMMDRLTAIDMSKVNSTTLGALDNLVARKGTAADQAAFAEMMEFVELDDDGDPVMITLVNQYKADGDMTVYYENYDTIANALKSIKKNLPIILSNEAIKAELQGLLGSQADMLDQIVAKLDTVTLSAPNDILDQADPAFPALLKALDTAAANGGNYVGGYADEELSLVSALEGIAGVNKATVTVKMTWNGTTLTSDTKTYGLGEKLVGAEEFVAEQKAALEKKFADTYAEIAYYELAEADLSAVAPDKTAEEDIVIEYTWQEKEYTVAIPGADAVTVKYTDTQITLPGTGNADYEYHYTVPGNGTVVVGAEAASVKIGDFGKLVSGTITVTKINVNEQAAAEKKAALIAMAQNMGNVALIEENGEYAFVLPVALSTDAASGMNGFFEELAFSDRFDDVLLDGEVFVEDGSAAPLHLQALVDAILNSGLTSDDVMNTKKLVLTDGQELLVKIDDLGELLVKLPMTLKGESGMADVETSLYITLVGDTSLWKDNANLKKALNYTSVVMDNGQADISVTLPEKFPFYEAYLALMVIDNGVKFDDIDTVGNALALEYLVEDLVKPVLSDEEVTLDTYNNTLAKLEKLAGTDLPELPDSVAVAGYTLDIASLYEKYDSKAANISVEYTDDGAKVDGYVPVQQVISKMNLSDTLTGMIAEYETGIFVTVNAKLTNTETKYDALFVAPNAEGLTNKIGLTENLAEEIGSIGAGAVIVLVDDVKGDLVFNNTTILDLNGNKVDGSIVANANVSILDTATDTDGEVTGTVSGTLAIQGGKFASDVSAYLPSGYEQVNGVVNNVIYTITSNGNDVNIALNLSAENLKQFIDRETLSQVKDLVKNPSVANLKEFLSDSPLTDLAIEMVADAALNYYGTAAFYLDGDKLYDVNLENAIETFSGSGKLNTAILTGLGWLDVEDASGETGISGIVNNIVAQLTDFVALNNAVNNGTPVVTAEVKIQPWDIQVARNENGDYLDVSILSNDEEETTGTLTITVETEDQEVLDTLAVLAETTTVEQALTLGITEAGYADKVATLKGTYTGTVKIDANDIVLADDDDSNDKYIMTLAVILAYSDTENQQAWLDAMTKATEDKEYTDLKALVDDTTINELWTAVKKNTRGGTGIQEMAAALGISEEAIEVRCALAVDVLAKVLRVFDVDGSSTKLGVFDPDGDGIYECTKSYTAIASPTVRGYTLSGELAFQNVTLILELFPVNQQEHKHVAGEPVVENEVAANCTEDGSYEKVIYCSVCHEEMSRETVTVPAIGHNWADGVVTKPTCTEQGYTTYTCLNDASHTMVGDYVDALGHTGVHVCPKVATCTESGHTEGVLCMVCGEILEGYEQIIATGHDMGEWFVTKTATCTDAGQEMRECVKCNYYEVREIEALGHAWGEWYEIKAVTADADGMERRDCPVCGAYETRVVPHPDHTHSYTSVVTQPTCTEDGFTTYTCGCGESYVDNIVLAKGHIELNIAAKQPTCTEEGNTAGKMCSVCGTVLEGLETIEKTAHTWGAWFQTKAASCEGNGEIRRECLKCEAYEVEETETLGGHAWGKWYETKVATCVVEGQQRRDCANCGIYDIMVIPVSGHTTVSCSAGYNCFVDGMEEHFFCTVCRAYLIAGEDGELVEITKDEMKDLEIPHHTCDGTQENCDALKAGLTDVKNSWYHDHVDCMIDRGIMIGVSKTEFDPSGDITRAMIAQMLWRMAGEPESNYTEVNEVFPDVTPNKWYAKAVMWAYESGVMKGVVTSSGTLEARPKQAISREQLITMIGRYVEMEHFKQELPDETIDVNMYTDVSEINSYAMKYFAWAIEVELVDGMGDGTLSPNSIGTRAQTAKLFHALIELVLDPAADNSVCDYCISK